jgi:hypothetical protein
MPARTFLGSVAVLLGVSVATGIDYVGALGGALGEVLHAL